MTKRLLLLLSLMMLALPFSPLHAEEEEGEKEGPKKAVYHAIGDKIVVNIKEGSLLQ